MPASRSWSRVGPIRFHRSRPSRARCALQSHPWTSIGYRPSSTTVALRAHRRSLSPRPVVERAERYNTRRAWRRSERGPVDTEPGIPAVPGEARWPWWTPVAWALGGVATITIGAGSSALVGPLPMFDGIRSLLNPPPPARAPAWEPPAPLLAPTTERAPATPERTRPADRPETGAPTTAPDVAAPSASRPPAPTTTPPRATPTPPPGGMGGGDDPPTTTEETTSAVRSEVPADPTAAPDPSGDPPRRTPADEPPRATGGPAGSGVPRPGEG